ncbi:hypothetical protein B0H14DRAFT_2650215 [Mycena olivaceomarginata]|nr:hypothetical protein B0H14DRAFT_2650215 [Mycena olivaceomarginata]
MSGASGCVTHPYRARAPSPFRVAVFLRLINRIGGPGKLHQRVVREFSRFWPQKRNFWGSKTQFRTRIVICHICDRAKNVTQSGIFPLAALVHLVEGKAKKLDGDKTSISQGSGIGKFWSQKRNFRTRKWPNSSLKNANFRTTLWWSFPGPRIGSRVAVVMGQKCTEDRPGTVKNNAQEEGYKGLVALDRASGTAQTSLRPDRLQCSAAPRHARRISFEFGRKIPRTSLHFSRFSRLCHDRNQQCLEPSRPEPNAQARMHLEFDEAILASPSIPPRSKSSVSLASTASSSFPRSSLVATVMSSIAPSRDWKFGAPAIVAGRSTRGDCTCAGPACGAPDDVGLKVVEMAGAPRLPFLGICTGIFPARAACGPGREALCAALDSGGIDARALLLRRVCNIVRLERRAALGGGGMSEPDDEAEAIIAGIMGVKRPSGEERRAIPRLWITRLRPRMIGEVSSAAASSTELCNGLQASPSTVEMGATLEDITENSKKAVRRGREASCE